MFSSVIQSTRTVWDTMTAACQATLSITNSQSLLKLISIESVMPSNHLILCRPLLFLPSGFPIIRVFSNEALLRIRWPKYWSFSFSISLSKEYSGLISFRMDWLDLLAVQGTLKSLLQHHSSKASVLWSSAFLWSSSYTHTWLLENHGFDCSDLCHRGVTGQCCLAPAWPSRSTGRAAVSAMGSPFGSPHCLLGDLGPEPGPSGPLSPLFL